MFTVEILGIGDLIDQKKKKQLLEQKVLLVVQ
jgi:hypothetical protein